MDILKTINEKKSISNNIADIMSSGDSKKKKSRRLEALRDNCKSNLGKAHIEYYVTAKHSYEPQKKQSHRGSAIINLKFCKAGSNHLNSTNQSDTVQHSVRFDKLSE